MQNPELHCFQVFVFMYVHDMEAMGVLFGVRKGTRQKGGRSQVGYMFIRYQPQPGTLKKTEIRAMKPNEVIYVFCL